MPEAYVCVDIANAHAHSGFKVPNCDDNVILKEKAGEFLCVF